MLQHAFPAIFFDRVQSTGMKRSTETSGVRHLTLTQKSDSTSDTKINRNVLSHPYTVICNHCSAKPLPEDNGFTYEPVSIR